MSDPKDPLVCRALYIRAFMERSRGDIRQWSWVWEKEIENIEYVGSHHMERSYEAKCAELGSSNHQIVFHGTDERSNVDSILHHGFDKNRVKRVRRGFSPAWTSSSFDKVEQKDSKKYSKTFFFTGFFLCSQAWGNTDEQTSSRKLLAGQLQT